MSQAAARVMVEQGKPGYIVNISSIMAKLALANQVAYCAAKGGVNQLTTAMGLALIDKGIRVNCVAPGPVVTELMQRVVHNPEKSEERATPAHRLHRFTRGNRQRLHLPFLR